MCRRIIMCSLCWVLLCCSCLGVAMAADVPGDALDSNPEDDPSLVFEQFLQELGFDTDNEEEISLFLTWLYPLQPENEREMGLILSGSEYSTLDADKVYALWGFLQAVLEDSDLYWAGDNTGGTGTSSQGTVSIGYIGWLPSQPTKIYLMERLPNNSADAGKVGILATIDFAAILAEQGYLTQASLTPLETLIRETNSLLSAGHGANGDYGVLYYLYHFLNILQNKGGYTVLSAKHNWQYDLTSNGIGIRGGDGTSYGVADIIDMNFKDLDSLLLKNLGDSNSLLTLIQNATVSTNDLLTQYVPNFADAVYRSADGNILSFVHDIRDVSMDYLPFLSAVRNFSYNQSSNTLASVSGGKPIGITQAVNDNFKDLDSLLLKNFGSSFSFSYTDFYYDGFFEGKSLPARSSLLEVLSAIGSTLYATSSLSVARDGLLGSNGSIMYPPYIRVSSSYLLNMGFQGLNRNMETALVGGHDGSAEYSRLTFDEDLNKKATPVNYTDLLHAMVGIGTDIQNPLSQLQAVLAGDADLELHRNTQENIDSVTDNFTGTGDGAVSSDDISDASGLTSGIGNAFGGNQVSTGDAFLAATDSGNFDFLSQECAVALDAVTYPAAVVLDADDDSWMSAYVADEDGFYSVADLSGWSFLDYLGKEG